jgi:hypothetical protein
MNADDVGRAVVAGVIKALRKSAMPARDCRVYRRADFRL